MLSLRLCLIAALVFATPALAQGTKQQQYQDARQHRSSTATIGARRPVATRPSNNPFQNPIGQGIPPAVSADPSRNSGQTNPR
jgi:hypothetical protein